MKTSVFNFGDDKTGLWLDYLQQKAHEDISDYNDDGGKERWLD